MNRERQLRRVAAQKGLALRKSRVRKPHLDNQGGYLILDPDRNWILAGEKFDLDLDGIEEWLHSRGPIDSG